MPEKKREKKKERKVAVVDAYAKALTLVHRREFKAAKEALERFITSFPDHPDMVDRATQYLHFCNRESAPHKMKLNDADAYYYAGVVKLNNGELDEAMGDFNKALEKNPQDAKLRFALATAASLSGDKKGACDHLKKAIKMEERFRVVALHTPDFDSLREEEDFIKLTAPPAK